MEIRGKLKYFIYPKHGQTTNDGFAVFKLNDFSTKESITVVGYSKSLAIGLNIRVQGEKKYHPKYGEQIEAKTIEVINPTIKEKTNTILRKNVAGIGKIDGVGYKRADVIAKNIGFQTESYNRIQEGIKYCLKQSLRNGDLFLYKKDLINRVIKLLGLNKEYYTKIDSIINCCKDIVKDDDRVYLERLYYTERNVAEKLMEILKGSKSISNISLSEIKKKISRIEKDMNIIFSKEQRAAIILAITNKLSIITGGPGTGKTTITKAIIRIYKETYGREVLLAAPTGKAAKKLMEATGSKAQTIHRLLEATINDGKMYFKKNNFNKLNGGLLIIDESSMIDIFLMKDLLQAVPIHMDVVFIGDVDQLPSIGPGNVFKSIISSNIIPLVKLEGIYRQRKNSLTIINSYRVNKGKGIIKKAKGEYINDFLCLLCKNDIEIQNRIIQLIEEKLLKYKTINPIRDIQVLTPMKRGLLGADNLNLIMRDILNKKMVGKNEINYSGVLYREGDKVMQIDNNYKKNVFNGDTGIIKRINLENNSITVAFEERDYKREVVYYKGEIKEILPSYAVTIHKSQGSEYPIIIIPISRSHTIMLNRSLLYTALTRGKNLAIIIGEERALNYCIENNRIKKRNTNIDGIIKDLFIKN